MKTKKECIRCGEAKGLSHFYKHKAMADGHLNKCSFCCKKEAKEREEKLRQNPEWVEKEKERGRKKYYRLGYKEKSRIDVLKRKEKGTYKKPLVDKLKNKEAINRYAEKYPEKANARVKSQRLKPKIKGNELHHWSYNEEHYKDVIELNIADHNLVHRKTIYDQERMMYRTLDGVLLDTKEAAIEYYKTLGVLC